MPDALGEAPGRATLRRLAPPLAFALGAAVGLPRLPDVPADPPPERFSAARAMAHVHAWATAPRPTGSARHAEVLDGVEAALRDTGLDVRRHPFVVDGLAGQNLVAGGGGADGVWLVAHSDSVPEAPGAADDGFGLAVVVEAARALAVDGPPAGLHVLITDAEERGLHGARAEAARAPGERRLVLNVEARGASGPVYMFQTAGAADRLLAAWTASGCRAQATSLARTVYDLLPNDTDFTIFRRAGWVGYDFALIHDAWRYHSPDDVPAGLDPRSVQQAGDCVVGLARAWLGAALPEPSGAAPVYAQVAGPTVVVPGWAVRAGGLLVLALELWPGPSRAAGGRGLGVLAWLLAAGLSVAAGLGLLAAFPLAWPDFWDRVAEAPGAGPRFGLLLAVGVVVPAGVLTLARRWGPAERGWLGVAVGIGAVAALALPAVGYVLLPGAFAAAFALRGRAWPAAAAALIGGVLLVPVLHAIYPALTSRAAPVLVGLPTLLLGFLAPGTAPRREG